MRGLYLRLTIAFIAITSGILLISTLMFIFETHYHFSMYQHQAMDMNADTAAFNAHFEQALVQSVLWTFVVGVFVAAAVSLFVAKRITNPLIQMKEVAEQMAKGGTHVRTNLTGSDELTDLGRSLNHLADQLNKQEQLRKMMTADVAHELRTPLDR